ncbi:aminotransferase class I/II-fold pyridoxal phosphate-dependent enzyme [Roseibium marinum]|uniref:8-amino-7-oxononanoate synthase n=1 Tax=Roseibium marinum TaxID=281252 RepID=A0A2S3UK20_9HYPH|nr:aminotransferase class I/II-fold pyridoxal phosphate-dependent enzyme [Roseibium marinum]POF28056.1 8-amino-7-oxononanoate synthase [Roseibium marinum]
MSSKRQAADIAFQSRIYDNAMMRRVRKIRADGQYLYHKPQTPVGSNETEIDGRRFILLGSTNYLGLAQDPRVVEAAGEASEKYGSSCTSSRLLTGTRPVHEELESRLAGFLGKEAALVFTTGYLANIGSIPALIGRHDGAYFDAEVHACIVDGVMLSGAERYRIRHNSVEDLSAKLSGSDHERKLVLIDSIYSLAGDVAPLEQIVDVADENGAWVMLDDAHGCGVIGPQGRGLAHATGVADRIPVIMGVFSKCFASTGGFVAGSAELIEHLRFNARSFLFSNALAPAQAAAALAALDILIAEPEIAERACALGERARLALRSMGWRCGGDGTQMVPVLIGDDVLAFKVTMALADAGVVVSPAVHPGVPKGKDLLRVTFPPTLTEDMFWQVLDAFQTVAAQFPEALSGAGEGAASVA